MIGMRNGSVKFIVDGVEKLSTEFGLIANLVNIPSPTPKTNYIDIEGADGSLDMTEAFGCVNYNDIDLPIEFTVVTRNYNETFIQFKSFLNGKRAKIILWNDDGFYYDGRCKINEFVSSRRMGTVVVQVHAKPYKFKNELTTVDVVVDGSKTQTFKSGSMRVVPTFKSTADMKLTYNGNTFNIGTSITKIGDIVFQNEDKITFTGTGTVTISYQEGWI